MLHVLHPIATAQMLLVSEKRRFFVILKIFNELRYLKKFTKLYGFSNFELKKLE